MNNGVIFVLVAQIVTLIISQPILNAYGLFYAAPRLGRNVLLYAMPFPSLPTSRIAADAHCAASEMAGALQCGHSVAYLDFGGQDTIANFATNYGIIGPPLNHLGIQLAANWSYIGNFDTNLLLINEFHYYAAYAIQGCDDWQSTSGQFEYVYFAEGPVYGNDSCSVAPDYGLLCACQGTPQLFKLVLTTFFDSYAWLGTTPLGVAFPLGVLQQTALNMLTVPIYGPTGIWLAASIYDVWAYSLEAASLSQYPISIQSTGFNSEPCIGEMYPPNRTLPALVPCATTALDQLIFYFLPAPPDPITRLVLLSSHATEYSAGSDQLMCAGAMGEARCVPLLASSYAYSVGNIPFYASLNQTVPVLGPTGVLLAENWAQFIAGPLNHSLVTAEVTTSPISWLGAPGNNCGDFLDNGEMVVISNNTVVEAGWTDVGLVACTGTPEFLCLCAE